MDYMDRELHEECGVFGIIGHQDASQICYYGLHSLQHRGQEAALSFNKLLVSVVKTMVK